MVGGYAPDLSGLRLNTFITQIIVSKLPLKNNIKKET
jgi:hypothetical protein